MIFCESDRPYKHKVRVKYSHRKGTEEFWKCPDCGEIYTLETDVLREPRISAPQTPTVSASQAGQLRMEGL